VGRGAISVKNDKERELMKGTIVITFVAALAVTAVVAGPAQAATPKERKLARQIKTLKAQNTTLKNRIKTLTTANRSLTNERNALASDKTTLAAQVTSLNGDVGMLTIERNSLSGQVNTLSGQVNTLSGQVNTLSGQLATAQQGAIPAIGTMSEHDLYFTVLPVIRDVFLGGSARYTYDFYSSGNDYSTRDFTYCGFC
jgi:outer membrane murein-binding lipoprotein Lpp